MVLVVQPFCWVFSASKVVAHFNEDPVIVKTYGAQKWKNYKGLANSKIKNLAQRKKSILPKLFLVFCTSEQLLLSRWIAWPLVNTRETSHCWRIVPEHVLANWSSTVHDHSLTKCLFVCLCQCCLSSCVVYWTFPTVSRWWLFLCKGGWIVTMKHRYFMTQFIDYSRGSQ